MATRPELFTEIIGANGNYPSAGKVFTGSARTFAIQGTFDSGTVKISASYDGGTTFITLTDSDGSDIAITSNSIVNVSVGSGTTLRFVLSGSSGSTDLDVFVA